MSTNEEYSPEKIKLIFLECLLALVLAENLGMTPGCKEKIVATLDLCYEIKSALEADFRNGGSSPLCNNFKSLLKEYAQIEAITPLKKSLTTILNQPNDEHDNIKSCLKRLSLWINSFR